ncbi:hypothetical protein [Epilithonimonas hungarica]|uniref:Apea-like HEPN domain-containing protein n=1 Tax=Epilithonimonas hungarica TaxID=454006 RepID=A0A1G7U927_9FLAO|nr:hypothetical protein [Epilithonimonas hungarica]SDG43270.1 hypothetical protein SAMN05421825_3341 [Epilithonimonas hungarica]
MWVAKNQNWNFSHTDLSKYFIEKIKQRVDHQEVISKKHRTTNGYTLVYEIREVSRQSIKRTKSINRLISLLKEAKSPVISSSIVNDYILNKYFPDIVEFYKKIQIDKLKDDSSRLFSLYNHAIIQCKQIENSYFLNIYEELKLIDLSSSKFNRVSDKMDILIDSLIPHILNIGYSTTSVSNISFKYISKNRGGLKTHLRIANFFNGNKQDYVFLLISKKESFEIETIKKYLDENSIVYKSTSSQELINRFYSDRKIEEYEDALEIHCNTLDPHNYIRNLYEMCLKFYVISKDRMDLSPLNDFFDRIYWRLKGEYKFQISNFILDPINVSKRKSSLLETLNKISTCYGLNLPENSNLPYIPQISDSLYYYNLALGSKSIENSLSLLWTSLETLLPYRMKENDISSIQHFVAKSLSTGSIGRELTAFAMRYVEANWNNNNLDSLGIYTNVFNINSIGLKDYFDFLAKRYDQTNDPYNVLKANSNLLCKKFVQLNNKFNSEASVKFWLDKVEASSESISYQLDRIYLHRNQIVHSGKFISEYSNLWSHLEWYVGKLLSFCVINYLLLEDKSKFSKEDIFYDLEANSENIINILKLNSDKKISEMDTHFKTIFKHSWQFF